MSENDKTLPAFGILTVVMTAAIYFGADLSGVAGLLVAAIVSAVIAIVLIGAWAIAQGLSK